MATRVAMCCFGMLLMALDKILFSFVSPEIFIRYVKKQDTHYVDRKRGICIVSGAVVLRTFLLKLISPYFQVEFILSETMSTMQISLKMRISDHNCWVIRQLMGD